MNAADEAVLFHERLILASAVSGGLWASLFASLLSVLSYNFFFLEPLYTFTIADPERERRAMGVFICKPAQRSIL
jgi:K+-sensing histidine kinase KdpD